MSPFFLSLFLSSFFPCSEGRFRSFRPPCSDGPSALAASLRVASRRFVGVWVWLKIKQPGQSAGFGPCFHLGQPILEFRFFETQPRLTKYPVSCPVLCTEPVQRLGELSAVSGLEAPGEASAAAAPRFFFFQNSGEGFVPSPASFVFGVSRGSLQNKQS